MSDNGFDKLKNQNPKEVHQRIIDGMYSEKLDIRNERGYWNRRERVLRSLLEVGNDKLYKKMKLCRREYQKTYYKHKKPRNVIGNQYEGYEYESCNSLWCDKCLRSKHLTYSITTDLRIAYGKLDTDIIRSEPSEGGVSTVGVRGYENDDLLHITGVLGICDVDKNKLRYMIDRDGVKWRRIRNRVNKYGYTDDLWIECVYEFELVNWRLLNRDDKDVYKREQMKQIIDRQKFDGDMFLFVHFHGITNLNKTQIRDVFGTEYYHRNKRLIKTDESGLFVQKLHSNKTVDENVRRMSRYPFKNPFFFKHSFIGSDYKSGERFTFEELGKLVTIYDEIQGRQYRTLLRSVENKKCWDLLRIHRREDVSTVKVDGTVIQMGGKMDDSKWLRYRSILFEYIVNGVPLNKLMGNDEIERLKEGGEFLLSPFLMKDTFEFGELHHSDIEGIVKRRLLEYIKYKTVKGKSVQHTITEHNELPVTVSNDSVLNSYFNDEEGDVETVVDRITDYDILKLVRKEFRSYRRSKVRK